MVFQKNVDFDVFNPKYLKNSNFPSYSERTIRKSPSWLVRKDIFQENQMEGIFFLKIAENPDKDCSKRRINICSWNKNQDSRPLSHSIFWYRFRPRSRTIYSSPQQTLFFCCVRSSDSLLTSFFWCRKTEIYEKIIRSLLLSVNHSVSSIRFWHRIISVSFVLLVEVQFKICSTFNLFANLRTLAMLTLCIMICLYRYYGCLEIF